MPYCNYCGSSVLEEDPFCTNCGTPQHLESGGAAAESVTPPAAPPTFLERPAAAEPSRPQEPEAAAPPPPGAESGQAGAGDAPPPGAGSAQPGAAPPPPPAGSAAAGLNLPANFAAMLCYLPGLGWIVSAAVLFFNLDPYRENRYVRFHAFQGLYLGAVWLLAQMFFFPHFGDFRFFPFPAGFRKIVQLLVVIAQIIGMIKTLKNQPYRLPVVGELAEKSLA